MSALPVGRLAPSPTGLLHLGHARTFLLAWWHARSRGGRVLMRMEDLDLERSRPGLDDQARSDLEWLGLDWDGPVVRQSERGELYRAALDRLGELDLVYPCVCTRREIDEAQSAPHGSTGPRYPGTCRGRFRTVADAERATGRSAALRFRPPAGTLSLVDAIAGPWTEDVAAEVGDFPVTRRDGAPAYQLAVVVDDADQGVTEVLRGDDLLASTARQAALQLALGLPHPAWLHVPLVTDPAGRRLAKRTDAVSLAHLRAAGVDPRELVAWAARTCGLEAPEPALPAAFLPAFDLTRLPRSPVPIPPGLPLDPAPPRA